MYGPTDTSTTEHDILGVEAGDIGYAVLLERHAAEEPITDDMVLSVSLLGARVEAESPVMSTNAASNPVETAPGRSNTLSRLFRARR